MPSGLIETPLVSVGVPVFNEEHGLAAVLDSLVTQDYERLQIIVCDNASTDRTLELAEDYAVRDPRIEVHRSDENRGATANFNRCFRFASGRYFTWAGGHDTRLPSAIRRCVDALEDDSALVLCYPRSLWRRFDGTTEPVIDDTLETTGLPPALRLHETIERLTTCNAVHGVIRSSALTRTRLFRCCFGSDHVLLAELSLLGAFHQLDENLFVRTENRAPEPDEQRLARTLEMLAVSAGASRSRPYTAMGLEHGRGAWHVSERTAKPLNAARAVFWFADRWQGPLAEEWHTTKGLQAAAAVRRRLPERPKNRRTRSM
jgi:hypothetical protein